MAQTPEVKVKNKIKAMLKKYDVYYAMPIGSGYGNAGVPDFLCCVNGKFMGIEAKAGSNQPTALQYKNLENIIKAQGYALVINESNIDFLEGTIKLIKGVEGNVTN